MAPQTDQHDVNVEYVRRRDYVPFCRSCRWEGVSSRNVKHAWDTARAHQRGIAIEAQKRAQADFVAAWRADHPVQAYTSPVICPLCGKAMQTVESGPFGIVGNTEVVMADMIQRHQAEHLDDWEQYVALGTPSTERGGVGDG